MQANLVTTTERLIVLKTLALRTLANTFENSLCTINPFDSYFIIDHRSGISAQLLRFINQLPNAPSWHTRIVADIKDTLSTEFSNLVQNLDLEPSIEIKTLISATDEELYLKLAQLRKEKKCPSEVLSDAVIQKISMSSYTVIKQYLFVLSECDYRNGICDTLKLLRSLIIDENFLDKEITSDIDKILLAFNHNDEANHGATFDSKQNS